MFAFIRAKGKMMINQAGYDYYTYSPLLPQEQEEEQNAE